MGFLQILEEGGETLIIGLTITFSVLALLIICIVVMSGLSRGRKPRSARTTAVQAPVPGPTVEPVAPAEDEDEVIAVISAVLAVMSQQSGSRFRLKAFRQVRNPGSWNRATRQDIMDARY